MIFSKFGVPAIAMVSVAITLAQGKEAINVLTAKPLIVGEGAYEQPVRAGAVVPVSWSIAKFTECDGSTSRVWTGEDFFLAEPHQATALPKGVFTGDIQTKIPELMPAGHAALTIKGFFDCPGEPRSYFTLDPVEFEVVQ